MSDYDDHDNDSNASNEGYGSDEYEDGGREYKFEEKDNIVNDVAFKDFDRVGGFEDQNMPFGTQAPYDVRGAMKVPPDVAFKIEVDSLLKHNDLHLSASNKSDILKNIKNLHLIKYKNPSAYVYGYYVSMDMSGVVSRVLASKLEHLRKKMTQNSELSMFEVIKYARWWKSIQI